MVVQISVLFDDKHLSYTQLILKQSIENVLFSNVYQCNKQFLHTGHLAAHQRAEDSYPLFLSLVILSPLS